jgi:acetyl esterase/lipase
MLAVQQPEPIAILLQVLMVPVCDNTATLESETWRERPRAPDLDAENLTRYQTWYLGDRTSPHWAGADWRASPLLAPRDVLCKSPKTHVVIASEDILQAENHRFVECLRRAGVDVTEEVYEGASHTFMRIDKMVPEGKRAIADMVQIVRKSLVA